jgi:RNA polymerase sigma factor (sigma-70 family)
MTAPIVSEAGMDCAFVRLYSCQGRVVRKVVKKLISREDDVDDIEQLAWIAILNALRSGRVPQTGHEAGWVGVIARQVAIDERRKLSRRRVTEVSPSTTARDGETASDYLDRLSYLADGYESDGTRTLSTPLTDSLQQLSPRARQIMELRFVAGLTSEEAGNALSLSAGSIDVSVSRSLKILRRDVKKESR